MKMIKPEKRIKKPKFDIGDEVYLFEVSKTSPFAFFACYVSKKNVRSIKCLAHTAEEYKNTDFYYRYRLVDSSEGSHFMTEEDLYKNEEDLYKSLDEALQAINTKELENENRE